MAPSPSPDYMAQNRMAKLMEAGRAQQEHEARAQR